jgi:ribose 5-phosphate isomerase A
MWNNPHTMGDEHEKHIAAEASLHFVRAGDIVGLGSGSTASIAVRLLGERVRSGLKITGLPTSANTAELASSVGIPLTTLDDHPAIDVTIDGADEINPQLDLIKGGGGALLREKVTASASKQVVIIADSRKQVARLGAFPLPVEVIGFAQAVVAQKLAGLGATTTLRKDFEGRPYLTDEGHHILDCRFGEIADPRGLAEKLDSLPGVVEHGLFIRIADVVLVGKGEKVVEIRAER